MEEGKTSILEVEGLSKSFAGLMAVKDLSLTVNEGEILGLKEAKLIDVVSHTTAMASISISQSSCISLLTIMPVAAGYLPLKNSRRTFVVLP